MLPSAERVLLAHVQREEGGRPVVCLLECRTVEQGVEKTLQQARSARQLGAYACTTLMAPGEYNLTQVDAPPVPAEERREAVRWGLKGQLDYPVESACIDLLDIPMEGSGRQAAIFAVTASEQAVLARTQPFSAAKLSLVAVDIPELAQRNVAALFEEENRGLAFLRLDSTGGLLTLTFHGELIAARRVEVSATLLAQADSERREQVMERLILELQRSLDNFDRQFSFIPVSRLVVAAYPPVEGLIPALCENLYLPAVEMDLAQVMDFPGIPELADPQHQAKNLLLIGAALRSREGAV